MKARVRPQRLSVGEPQGEAQRGTGLHQVTKGLLCMANRTIGPEGGKEVSMEAGAATQETEDGSQGGGTQPQPNRAVQKGERKKNGEG